MLAAIFDGFIEASPVSVMLRGLLEKVFRAERLDAIFEQQAQAQYTRELLFSDLVNLLSLVVCGIHPSINAAYKAKANEVNVTRNAIYAKLTGVETAVSAALLRDTAGELSELVGQIGGKPPALLANYQVWILDGNALAATERRLKVLRSEAAAPLPGKSLVVLDPSARLAVDLFPCEDGHAQERRLFGQVLATIKPQQLWIADRNMCTLGFLTGIAKRKSAFAIREHQNLPWKALSDLQPAGQVKAGDVLEQTIEIEHDGNRLRLRRVVLRLDKATRHGDAEIVVLTNLPVAAADAVRVVVLYRERWKIEGLFLTVTQNFEGEIDTLAYPKAALLSFSLALMAYNVLATLRAALASVHGVGKIEAALSDFYVVEELQGVYRGMMIAIPPLHWKAFEEMSILDLAQLLKNLAAQVELKRFLKQPRKKKKKKKPLALDSKRPHVSTANLLKGEK
ncbi:MAG: transposase [Cyanobacteria bacterium J06649_4]